MRVPDNTITPTPDRVRTSGARATDMPRLSFGAPTAPGFATEDARLRGNANERRRIGARADEKIQRTGAGLNGIAQGAEGLARVMDMRAEARADRDVAEFQDYLTKQMHGWTDEQGQRHDGALDAPFNPGDEGGEGASGATKAVGESVSGWMEEKAFEGRRAVLFAERSKGLVQKAMGTALERDTRNYERYRVESAKALYQANVNDFHATGDAGFLNRASIQFAYANTPKADILNWAEWSRSVRAPSELEFANDAARERFNALSMDAHERVLSQFVGQRMDAAMSRDVGADAAEAVLAELESSGGGFARVENQKEFAKMIAGARERRKGLEARWGREDFAVARDLTTREMLGAASDDDLRELDGLRSKMPPERVYELDNFRENAGANLESAGWDDLRARLSDGMNADNAAERLADMEEYVAGMQFPFAKERAAAQLARIRKMGGDDGGESAENAPAEKWDNDRLDVWIKFGSELPAEKLRLLNEMAGDDENPGVITPKQFARGFEALRKAGAANPENVLRAMQDAGFDVKGIFAIDKNGNVRFDKDGRPMTAPGVSASAVYDDALRAVFDFSVEYQTQINSGAVRKQPLSEYLKTMLPGKIKRDWDNQKVVDEMNKRARELESEWEDAFVPRVRSLYGIN